jgi:hypothetical protein
MAISNNSTGLRPGVCTSTTRPTAPYEGQTIYETDTDLTYTYGGSAWQQVSGGTAVGNSGLVYITTATASGTSSTLNVVGCFSSLYTDYRITLSGTFSSYPDDIYIRMLNGSTPVATGTYGWAWQGLGTRATDVSTSNYDRSEGVYSGMTTYNAPTDKHHAKFDVMSPNVAVRTYFLGQGVGINSGLNAFNFRNGGGYQESATSFDGFQIRGNGGYNLTTTVRVYGYRKA